MKTKKYNTDKFFDEYINKNNTSIKNFKVSFNFFKALSNNKKKLLSNIRDSIIRSMGVTFRVYDNNRYSCIGGEFDSDWIDLHETG